MDLAAGQMPLGLATLEAEERILVFDFGSQYSHLIVRRCRELGIYSELIRGDCSSDKVLKFEPRAVILSGGPYSVYDADAPHLSDGVLNHLIKENIPVLGICYGLQELVHVLGGKVASAVAREYGSACLSPVVQGGNKDVDVLFDGIGQPTTVWMSHGDKVIELAEGFDKIAYTSSAEFAAVACKQKRLWGVQFHPEVSHTTEGKLILSNFLLKAAGLKGGEWSVDKFVEKEVKRLRDTVGGRTVIGAVSGGVDSTVAAALMHRAVGENFHPFLIDTGLLRSKEAEQVVAMVEREIPGMKLSVIDASQKFLEGLRGVVEPEEKRRIIGKLFIDEFEKVTATIKEQNVTGGIRQDTNKPTPTAADASQQSNATKCVLLQGTLYPDVIESISFKGPSHTIKTHHNVGGLPEKFNLDVVEPLRELFKDEVRQLGMSLGLERRTVWRHPFPGPGLAIRIVGEVTQDRVSTLQLADNIFLEELKISEDYWKIGQAFAVLLPGACSVGVMGDKRTYEMSVALRAVETSDYMTADCYELDAALLKRCATRIVNEVPGVNRVVFDVTSKPPGTIEWE